MNWKQNVISFLNTLPYVRGLYQEKMNYKKNSCFPPGHFYSPIISVDDIKERQDKIWNHEKVDGIEGVNLNVEEQKKLLRQFEQYYEQMPFPESKSNNTRYYFENDFYSYTDAIVLYSMIRHFQPKQIIEVGSGFSSAVMLDTNEYFFANSILLTFIEPYTDRLRSLLKSQDYQSSKIIEKKVQEVDVEVFKKLNEGDFLFIDSSHVCKTGSDVNYIFFEILPVLKKGVLVHFHDIFYPFEYPKEWVLMGRNWNEDYLLRAFLMYNTEFEIKVFSHYLHKYHSEVFKNMPLCYKNSGGNLWLMRR